MMTRCNNSKSQDFKNYGGRGIKVCAGWHFFENFLAYMGERPEGKTIERKDMHGDYTPGNCVWATKAEQASNTRASRYVEFGGEHLTQAQFARKIGIKESTVSYRLRRGWSPNQVASIAPYTGNRIVSKLGETVEVPKELL